MSDVHQPKAAFAGATGVKDEVQQKSRARRRAQKALVEAESSIGRAGRNDLVPRLELEFLPTDCLRPASRRVRRSDPEQVARVEASIARHGLSYPILIDAERRIIHGHLHPAAVTDLQIEEIIDAVAQRGKAAMARHLLRTSLSQSACPG
jgi:hypothetical protein